MSEEKECRRIAVTLCRECDAMYDGLPPEFDWDDCNKPCLPCGHALHSTTFAGSHIREAFAARRMLEWLLANDQIDDVIRECVETAGGYLKNAHDLKVPERELTEDDWEEMNFSIY